MAAVPPPSFSPEQPNGPTQPKINWADFPAPVPTFWESRKTQKIAGVASLIFATISGLGTAYAGLAFTATPIVVASTFCGLALLTIALAATGIYLLRKAPSENDPELCKQRARAAGTEIEKNNMGYAKIDEKYGHLIKLNRINVEAIRASVDEDARTMKYVKFVEKHGNKDGIALAKEFLSNPGKQALRAAFIVHVTEQIQQASNLDGLAEEIRKAPDDVDIPTQQQFQEIYLAGCAKNKLSILEVEKQKIAKALNLSFDEIAKHLADGEAAQATSYSDFLKRNSKALKYVTDTTHKAHLEKLFLDSNVFQKDIFGTQNIDSVFQDEIKCFGAQIRDTIRTKVFAAEVERFMHNERQYKETAEYRAFREHNTIEMIQATYAGGSAEYKAKLRSTFLSMGYEDVASSDYAEDRKMLNLEGEALLETCIDYINSVAPEKYLGKDGFQEKFGKAVLTHNRLAEPIATRYKKEIIQHLLVAPVGDVDALKTEMACLEIKREDILKARWNNKTIPEIVRTDRSVFFAEAPNLYTKETLVNKVLKDVPTITQIIQNYPEFFTLKILGPSDALTGKDQVSERLDKEIQNITSLEELFKINAELIFKHFLLPLDNLKLNTLILNFMASNSRALLTSEFPAAQAQTQSIWNALNAHNRVPAKTDKPLVNGRDAVKAENQRNAQRKAEIEKAYQDSIDSSTSANTAAVQQAVKEADLQTHETLVAAAGKNAKALQTALEQRKAEHQRLTTELQQARSHVEKIRADSTSLQQEHTKAMSISAQMQTYTNSYNTANTNVHGLQQAKQQALGALQQQIDIQQRNQHQLETALKAANERYEGLNAPSAKYQNHLETLKAKRAQLEKAQDEAKPTRLAELEAKFKGDNGQVTGIGGVLNSFKADPEKKELETLRQKAASVKTLSAEILQMENSSAALKSNKEANEQARKAALAKSEQLQGQFSEVRKQVDLLQGNSRNAAADFDRQNNVVHAQQTLSDVACQLQNAQSASQRYAELTVKIRELEAQLTQANLKVSVLDGQIAAAESHKEAAIRESAKADLSFENATNELNRRKQALASIKHGLAQSLGVAKNATTSLRDTNLATEGALHGNNMEDIIDTFKRAIG